jgi:hypothetical protein
MENSSGQGKNSEVPSEIRVWNWGAFFLSVIWGLFNRTYIALLTLIPFVGVVMVFVLGFKGNEWAWQNKRWKSIEQFQRVQKHWAKWGIILFIVGAIASMLAVKILLPVLKVFKVIPD